MDIKISVMTYSNGKMTATADFPEDVMEQIKDSFPSTDTIKDFIHEMMPLATNADEFIFAIRYKNLDMEG